MRFERGLCNRLTYAAFLDHAAAILHATSRRARSPSRYGRPWPPSVRRPVGRM